MQTRREERGVGQGEGGARAKAGPSSPVHADMSHTPCTKGAGIGTSMKVKEKIGVPLPPHKFSDSASSSPTMKLTSLGMHAPTDAPKPHPKMEMQRPSPVTIPIPSTEERKMVIREVPKKANTPTPSESSSGTGGGARSRIVRQGRVPVGPKGRLPLDCLGASSEPSSVSFASPNLNLPQARVNAIGQMSNVVGVTNLLLSEALRATRVRKFSGKAEDFEDFEREWNEHLKIMHEASQGTLPDTVVLMTLRNYLDDASAALLHGKMIVDSDLSYYEFWDELKSTFMRDARAIHRQNWRGVKLVTAGSRVTLQEWAKFQAQYVAKRVLVEDWADAEDQQHVFSQVPSGLQAKLLAETRKRRHDKLWVRILIPEGMTCTEILAELQAELAISFRQVNQEKRHVVVACRDAHEVRLLTGLDGSKIDRHVLKIQRAEYNMSGDEMFAFIRRLLETDDELQVLRRSYGCVDRPAQKEVHVVQAQDNGSKKETPEGPQRNSRPWSGSRQEKKGKSGYQSPATRSPNGSVMRGKQGSHTPPPPESKKTGTGDSKRRPNRAPICLTCWSRGDQHEHDHTKCSAFITSQEAKKKRNEAKDTPASPAQTRRRSE